METGTRRRRRKKKHSPKIRLPTFQWWQIGVAVAIGIAGVAAGILLIGASNSF